MNILNITNLTKAYTERSLFEDAAFSMQDDEKVGVIGINGTGKSTLLRIVAGVEEMDSGKMTKANGLVIRYLPQNPELDEDKTVLENALSSGAEGDAKTMLTKLGFTDFNQKTSELSGGQRKRLALTQVLLDTCDLLILDEPTNHLDQQMASWLEDYLKKRRGALLMVTHDRYFLDSVSNRIVEIDKGSIYSYNANYSGFLELKAQREEMQAASERKRQSILRVEIEWIRRGARARSTKQKAHIQRYESLRDQKAPEIDAKMEMSSAYARMGKQTIEIENLTKSFEGRTLIKDFTYNFLRNDRVGFVGQNGCGKTTLMKMLVGRVQPTSGSIITGQTIKIGYYSQELEDSLNEKFMPDGSRNIAYMDPNIKVIDYIRDTAEYIRTEDGLVSATVMLERFLFPAEKQYSLLGKLSGGEKRRLNLLRVLMEAPNVLILDEPTNDLDISTLMILEDYLDHFEGIVITVSHDRYFLDRTVSRIFAFENSRIVQYEGNYTDYENKTEQDRTDLTMGVRAASAASTEGGKDAYLKNKQQQPKKLKFSYNEQREYETIEEDIVKLEDKLADIDAEIEKNATNSAKLSELMAEKDELNMQLLEKMDRWEYLEDLAQKIAKENA